MKKLLGMNGLSTDETVTRYFDNGNGLVLVDLWGSRYTISPTQALSELMDWREREHIAELRGDPLAVKRMDEIQRAICAVEAML